MRIRLLELLVDARGEPDVPDVSAVAELARLQPLVAGRVEDLRACAEGELAERARTLRALLSPGGLEPPEEAPPPDGELHTITSDLLETKLRHPATREGGAMAWLQEKLGHAKAPEQSALVNYAERITSKNQPELLNALSDVAMALGVNALEAYISRGDMNVGVRAYEGSPPFLLVGADHLDPETDHVMSHGALLFTLGSEVAHLRFKHTRLTSSDLWDGVWAKGAHLLEVVGTFAGPLGFLGNAVSGLGRLAATQSILSKAELMSTGAGKALEVVGFAKGIQASASGEDRASRNTEIGDRESEMLAACRLMQLTADRTGLTVCGDLRSAVEAIFLSSAEYRVELPLARRHGLIKTLSRRDGDGELINQALAIRLAALFSFFLSSDYVELRRAVLGPSPDQG